MVGRGYRRSDVRRLWAVRFMVGLGWVGSIVEYCTVVAKTRNCVAHDVSSCSSGFRDARSFAFYSCMLVLQCGRGKFYGKRFWGNRGNDAFLWSEVTIPFFTRESRVLAIHRAGKDSVTPQHARAPSIDATRSPALRRARGVRPPAPAPTPTPRTTASRATTPSSAGAAAKPDLVAVGSTAVAWCRSRRRRRSRRPCTPRPRPRPGSHRPTRWITARKSPAPSKIPPPAARRFAVIKKIDEEQRAQIEALKAEYQKQMADSERAFNTSMKL